jgi:hypothetical protein
MYVVEIKCREPGPFLQTAVQQHHTNHVTPTEQKCNCHLTYRQQEGGNTYPQDDQVQHCAWFFVHCWRLVLGYKLEMVRKLMESFDVDAALLAHFSEFNTKTLTVKTPLETWTSSWKAARWI